MMLYLATLHIPGSANRQMSCMAMWASEMARLNLYLIVNLGYAAVGYAWRVRARLADSQANETNWIPHSPSRGHTALRFTPKPRGMAS